MYIGSPNSPFINRDIAFDVLFSPSLDNFVDFGSYTCNFDSEKFIRLLDFCNTFDTNEPVEWANGIASNLDPAFDELQKALVSKSALLEYCDFVNVRDFLAKAQSFGLFDDDNFTFLISPSADRRGTICSQNNFFCSLPENSACPEGAWEYFCYVFGEKFQETYLQVEYMFTSNSKALDRKIKEGLKTVENDWDTLITEETKQYILDYIHSCDKLADRDPAITEIVSEETSRLFSGEISSAECAKMVQNRVSLYLSEQS